jgi:pimeloyl-ACP methyl ester carboxylesterase
MKRTARKPLKQFRGDRLRTGLAATGIVLGLAALFVRLRIRQAERQTPPVGRFIEIDGVRLHYVERGAGQPVVLLHGSGGLIQDMQISGLVDRLARSCRVIVFDRPGFGYSTRPRTRLWTPEAQAALLGKALAELGVPPAVVVGHSWATLVAIALGLDHPRAVRSLVLLSGYHFPTFRPDIALFAALLGAPLVGALLRNTVGPLIARTILPVFVRRLFRPNPVSARFSRFPIWMALRPFQSRAVAAEAGLLLPSAARLSRRYGELRIPVYILAGGSDRHISTATHSVGLHEAVPQSFLRVVAGAGHMIHYVALEEVARAIGDAAATASPSGVS